MAASGQPPPTRVLVVSAPIGEGHNSVASSLVTALRQAQPGCIVDTVDMFDRIGHGGGTFVRRLYHLAIQLTPPLQDLWYWAVARLAAVRWIYREPVGARVARGLSGEVSRYRPDVIVSTYPLATAGLSWLRRNGRLSVPLLAVLSDFAPHAFWIYPDVTRYFVLSERSRTTIGRLAPDAAVSVCGPLVRPAFRPSTAEQAERARRRHGIPLDSKAVLVSCGALGLGSVGSAVDAVLAAGPRCHAVVVCGHNQRLADGLRGKSSERLTVLGWIDDMAELMTAVDVVVNNAGGLTAAEALASGRALVMYRPIAGHGRDCARALREAGLAAVAGRKRALTRLLGQWFAEPERLHAARRRAIRHARAHRLTDTARAILQHAEPSVSARDAAS